MVKTTLNIILSHINILYCKILNKKQKTMVLHHIHLPGTYYHALEFLTLRTY